MKQVGAECPIDFSPSDLKDPPAKSDGWNCIANCLSHIRNVLTRGGSFSRQQYKHPSESPAARAPVTGAGKGLRSLWMLALGLLISGAALAQSADLVVNHSDSPDPGPAGGIFTYTLRIDNNGPNAANSVTLADTLPPGSSFVDVATTAGTCTPPAGGVINCVLGNIPFTAPVTSFVTVTIRVRLPTAGVWTNTATAGSATSDPNTSNNVNSIQGTTAVAASDLALAAVPSAATVTAGQAFSYALTSTNNGPDALPEDASQTISFTVPTGTSITGVPTGSGWSCVPASGYPLSSGNIVCTRPGALGVGASAAVLTIPAVSNIAGTVTAAFAVAATKADASVMPDGDLANNTTTVNVTSNSGSDVSILKTASPTTVAQNSNVTYTLTPRLNGGEQPGAGGGLITVTDTLGAGLGFVSASGSGWNCGNVAQVVTCTRVGPYTGGNFTNMPAITVVATAVSLGSLSNTGTIAIPETDPVPANNTSSINIVSSNDADLRMTKAASVNPVVPNQDFNYTLTVRDLGPLAVLAGQTMSVTDTLPANISLTALPTGSGWTCSHNGAGGFPIAGPVTITCNRAGPLSVNANAPAITVPARVTVAGAVLNNACVALTGTGPVDSNATNDCNGVTVTATATQADLHVISKTATPATVNAGENLTYVITVENLGPDAATNVTVTDTLASLVNTGGFQSVVASQGSCTPNTVTNGTSQNLSCNLGTLNAAATATVTVVVRPSIATSGNRSNTASIRSPDIGDPVLSNNSASVTSAVTAIADIAVSKTATPLSVPAGAPLTFVATVRNNGPSTAQTVSMSDTLPANAAFIAVTGVAGGGSCTTVPVAGAVGGNLVCGWASIASGSQVTVTYQVRPLSSAVGSNVVNNVAATTATAESTLANNSATTSTPVTAPQLDILINKVDSVDPVDLGQSTVYTITINNSGPSYGTNVVMTDIFPAPGASPTATFSYQGALTVNAGGVCVEPAIGVTSGTLTCTFPGLASGQSAVVTYAMRAESLTVPGATSGTAFNRASVTVDEVETTNANNTVTHDTTARRFSVITDLGVTKTVAAGTLVAGANIDYSIRVVNNGPVASDGAQVIDVLPAGVSFVSAAGCVHLAGTVTCPVGPLAVGADRVFALKVQVNTPYNGAIPLVNTATVDAPGDPVPGNNTSTASLSPLIGEVMPVPTLSEWALLVLTGLVLLGGLMGVRRKPV